MIKTERLVLRPLEEGDLDRVTELLQDKEIHKYMERVPYPYSRKDAEALLRSDRRERDAHHMVITLNGEVVGRVSLMRIFRGRAQLGYWLGKAYWGKGIMTEAVSGMLNHYSGEIDLVVAHAAVPNKASQRVLEKTGFRRVAILPRYHRNFNGEINDAYLYLRHL